jgi:hypothetical protein
MRGLPVIELWRVTIRIDPIDDDVFHVGTEQLETRRETMNKYVVAHPSHRISRYLSLRLSAAGAFDCSSKRVKQVFPIN